MSRRQRGLETRERERDRGLCQCFILAIVINNCYDTLRQSVTTQRIICVHPSILCPLSLANVLLTLNIFLTQGRQGRQLCDH